MNSENYVFNKVHFELEIFKWRRKQCKTRAVVVAQLIELLLPTSDVRSSNPVIGKIKIYCMITVDVLKRRK